MDTNPDDEKTEEIVVKIPVCTCCGSSKRSCELPAHAEAKRARAVAKRARKGW